MPLRWLNGFWAGPALPGALSLSAPPCWSVPSRHRPPFQRQAPQPRRLPWPRIGLGPRAPRGRAGPWQSGQVRKLAPEPSPRTGLHILCRGWLRVLFTRVRRLRFPACELGAGIGTIAGPGGDCCPATAFSLGAWASGAGAGAGAGLVGGGVPGFTSAAASSMRGGAGAAPLPSGAVRDGASTEGSGTSPSPAASFTGSMAGNGADQPG